MDIWQKQLHKKWLKKIHKVILEDDRINMKETAEALGKSSEWVLNILHEHLGMKKLCARWVSCLLTFEQKQQWKEISKDNLRLFNHRIFVSIHNYRWDVGPSLYTSVERYIDSTIDNINGFVLLEIQQ